MQVLEKQDEVSERIFMMRAYEEHSFTQIAQMMGMDQGAVKARYYKTVKLIQQGVGRLLNKVKYPDKKVIQQRIYAQLLTVQECLTNSRTARCSQR